MVKNTILKNLFSYAYPKPTIRNFTEGAERCAKWADVERVNAENITGILIINPSAAPATFLLLIFENSYFH